MKVRQPPFQTTVEEADAIRAKIAVWRIALMRQDRNLKFRHRLAGLCTDGEKAAAELSAKIIHKVNGVIHK